MATIKPTRVIRIAKDPKDVIRGVGDVVARIAKPIARAIDARLGTDLENCKGCNKRRETLNQAFPIAGALPQTTEQLPPKP